MDYGILGSVLGSPYFGKLPYIIYQQKKGYPYCNMVTGLPRNPKPCRELRDSGP